MGINFFPSIQGGSSGGGLLELIEDYVAASDELTHTFSGIPAYPYYLMFGSYLSAAGDELDVRLNGDSGANYARSKFTMSGGSTGGTAAAGQTEFYAAYKGPTYRNFFNAILDCSAATNRKTFFSQGGTPAQNWQCSGDWSNVVDLITSLTIFSPSNWGTTSRFSLYGLRVI